MPDRETKHNQEAVLRKLDELDVLQGHLAYGWRNHDAEILRHGRENLARTGHQLIRIIFRPQAAIDQLALPGEISRFSSMEST